MLTLLLAENAPGSTCGALVCPLLALAAILKCIGMLRKPDTNRLCAIALTLAFGALGLLPVLGVLALAKPPILAAILAVSLAYWSLLVAAVVTAIIGLVQCSMRRDLYRHGRGPAIWALVIACSLILIGIGSVVSRTYGVDLTSGLRTADAGRTRARIFEDLNFRMLVLPQGWSDIDMSKVNEDATVGYIRRNPVVFFVVIAERLGVETGMTSDALAAMAQGVMRSAASEVTIGESEATRVGGIDGLLFDSTATVHGKHLAYTHWVAAHNGYGYQLMAWGERANARAVARESAVVREHFALLDPDRKFYAGTATAADIDRPALGFRIRMADSGWRETPEEIDAADTTMIAMGDMVYLILRPLRLDGIEPTEADLEALLLPDEHVATQSWTRREDTRFGNLPGRLLEWESTADGAPLSFRARVVRGEHFAYAVTGWGLQSSRALETLEAFLSRIELLDEVVPVDDLTAEERERQADQMLQLRQIAQQRQDWPMALQYTEQAHRLAPGNVNILNMLAWAHEDLGQHARALAVLDEHGSRHGDDPRVEANRAFQMVRLGRVHEAVALYAAQFADGLQDDAYFEDYLDQLDALERYDEAIAALEANPRYKTEHARALRKASLLRGKGSFDEALAIYHDLQNPDHPDPTMTLRIADAQFDAGQYIPARAACDGLVADGTRNAYVHYLRGRCELELNRYPQAKEAFEAALQLDPTDNAAESYLDYVSGLLGQGDNSMLKRPLEPVELPDEIAAAVAGARPPTDPADEGSLVETDITAISYEPGTALRTTRYRTIQVQSDDGVADWSTLVFDFDPLGEDIFVNWVRVSDLDGTLLTEGSVDDYYALDSTDGEASQDKHVHIPVPGVRAGVRIEVAVTWESRPGPEHWPYREEIFAPPTPTGLHGLVVRGPLDTLRSESSPEVTRLEGEGWRAWIQRDLPAFAWEPFQPTYDAWIPTVAISDARAAWTPIGDAYLASIAEKLGPDPEVERTAREVAGDLSDPDARLAALAAYVQKNLTYKAIEFGVRARQPNPPAVTLRNRYGDCKDHAVLLQQLLAAADVPAHLALMNTREVVRTGMPSLDQFNHMVVAVPQGGGYQLLDCTNKTVAPGRGPSAVLADEQLLILRPGASEMIESEPYPDDLASVEIERTVTLAENLRDLEIRETVRPLGAYADALRSAFRGSSPREMRETAQAYLDSDRGLELVSVEAAGIDEWDRPLVLSFDYRARDRMHRSGAQLRGDLPLPWARSYFRPRRMTDERTSPLNFNLSATLKTTTRLELPPQVAVADAVRSPRNVETPVLQYSARFDEIDGALRRITRLRRVRGLYPAGEYERYQTANQEAIDLFAGPLLLEVRE